MLTQLACLVLVLASGSAPVWAQNALDRPIQRDLRLNGAAGYTRPDFAAEVRLRNALVTGNVGGGKSLQIDRPYAGPDDFRGSLGTDSLFAFRRDSFGFSDTNTFRNSDALTFQTLYSTGNNRTQADVVSRFGNQGAAPSNGTSAVSATPNPFTAQRFASPTDTLPPGALRSTGEYISTRGLTPTLIGFEQSREGQSRVTASSLLGVRSTLTQTADQLPNTPPNANSAAPAPIDASAQGKPDNSYQTAYDLLRERLNANRVDTGVNTPLTPPDTKLDTKPDTKPEIKPGPDAPRPNTPLSSPTAPSSRPSTPPGGLTAPTPPLNPSGLPENPTPGAQDPDANPPPWERRMRDLRTLLEAPTAAPAGANRDEPTPQQRAIGLDTPEKVRSARAGLDAETIAILRKPSPQVNTYITGEARPGDLYAEQLFAGQKFLSEGKYFYAEERFASAAAMRPGDVTSLIGRINSQLGAGLYVSAAVNLRSLYTRSPEVIPLRFTGAAVPPIERMTALLVDLRQQVSHAKDQGIPPRAECAFLLAYVGYQLENTPAVRDGLAESKALQTQNQAQAEPLLDLLEAVWLYRDVRAIPASPVPAPSK